MHDAIGVKRIRALQDFARNAQDPARLEGLMVYVDGNV